MRIQHNIMAMNAYRNYNLNTSALSKNLEKLSSGYKINRAGDDAAGLAISEKMRAQITGLEAAQKNVKDGISLVKTAEGAMQEIQDMLNRMDYLATQSANGTYDNDVDRKALQDEVDQLRSEINRIADSANFNGINLLDGKNGLDSGAFTIAGTDASTVDAVGTSVEIPSANFTATDPSVASSHEIHFTQAGVSQQATVSFKVDFKNLALEFDENASATVNVTVNIGGQDITLSVSAGTSPTLTAGQIASAVVAAFNTVTGSDGTANVGGCIGDIGFTASANGSVVTFTFAGVSAGATINNQTSDNEYNETQADAINDILMGSGADVKVTVDADTKATGDYLHGIKDVTAAAAKTDTKGAGIDFLLNDDVVQDGYKLTIDDKTFYFKTDAANTMTAGSVSAAAGEYLIDVSKYDAADQAKQAAIQIAQTAKATTNFDITADNEGTIHIDQKVASIENYKYTSFDGDEDTDNGVYNLKNVFKLENPSQAQAAVTTGATKSVTIDPSKLKEGNKLQIGDKTFVFTSNADTLKDGEIQVAYSSDTGVSAADLADKLNGLTGTPYTATVSGDTVTIANSTASANMTAGIKGVGQGLTLQIGDTSAQYNQLNVTIGDMHVSAMGTMDANGIVQTGKSINDINIGTQAGAQQAVDVIKNAINYVSSVRGTLGATQNRLDHTANNLSVMAENIQDAESSIRDTDVASEMMSYVKNNILVQSAQAMLAQANQVPQGVLQLLG